MAIVPPHTHPRHEHQQYAAVEQLSGRNRIINGDFSVNQRAFTTISTALTYGFDRWRLDANDGAPTYTSQTPALGDLPESARAFARVVVTGQTLAGALTRIEQPIEGVRTLSGKTVTVSFWAKAAAGTPKVAVELSQFFGTTGSPSADVNTYAGQVTLSTSWTRYSVTVAVPSIAGKTLGSDLNDYLGLRLWTSAGTTYNARTGSLGIQNATIDFWGVQVEEGSYATPYEQKTYAEELRACQRYYYRMNQGGGATRYALGNAATASAWNGVVTLPVPLRSTPTLGQGGSLWALSDAGALGMTSVTVGLYAITQPAFPTNQIWITKTGGTGTLVAQCVYYLENAGGSGAYLDFSAEL